MISLIAEGFLFLTLGVASWQIKSTSEEGDTVIASSAAFIALSVVILFIARFVNVFIVTWMFRPCKSKDKWRVNAYELQIIYASGLVKGAVPFALITSTTLIAQSNKTTSLMIKASVIMLVFFTSILINAVLPVFIRNRIHKIKKYVKEGHPSLFDSLLEKARESMRNEAAETP
jgi:NhaP-type Na+/H+ or K+/H+ antiporter